MKRSFQLKCCALMLAALAVQGGRAAAQSMAVSNGVYNVHVESAQQGANYTFGSWNVVTGVMHPAGNLLDIFYTDEVTYTNFSTLAVFAAGDKTTYAMGEDLDFYFSGEGPTPSSLAGPGRGWRTEWDVTPENIAVTQDVIVTPRLGYATPLDSAVYHTVLIKNNGATVKRIGWRNLYDWALNDDSRDDGPTAQLENDCGADVVLANTQDEFIHEPVTADFCRFTADQTNNPAYQGLLALTFDPGHIEGLPLTVPDSMVFGYWPDAFGTDFDYVLFPGFPTSDDSATMCWFGKTDAQAIVLAPGAQVRLTQIVFAVATDACPAVHDNAVSEVWAAYE